MVECMSLCWHHADQWSRRRGAKAVPSRGDASSVARAQLHLAASQAVDERLDSAWCGGVRVRSGPWPIPCSRGRRGCVTHRRGVLVDRAGRTRPQGRYAGYGGRFLSVVVRPRFLEHGGDAARRPLQTLSDTDDESCCTPSSTGSHRPAVRRRLPVQSPSAVGRSHEGP